MSSRTSPDMQTGDARPVHILLGAQDGEDGIVLDHVEGRGHEEADAHHRVSAIDRWRDHGCMTVSPFGAVPRGGNWRHNAILASVEDDHGMAIGFFMAGEALVRHWTTSGPNDGLFFPIVLMYRHALELVLKAAIREAARRLRADGDPDPNLYQVRLDAWLASPKGGGHSLQALGDRLEGLLGRLQLEQLPAATKAVLQSLHELDPGGDSFRYATVRDRQSRAFIPAPRPDESHVDVVAMGKVFGEAFYVLSGGVLTVLDEYRDYQAARSSYFP